MTFRIILFRLFLLSGLLAAGACSTLSVSSPEMLKLDGEMRYVRDLEVGQTLTLDVRNPGAGGYEFAGTLFDPAILRLENNSLIPPEKARPGDFGRATFEFLALAPGWTEVVIKIHRPFEKDLPPDIYKVVEVRVGGQSAPAKAAPESPKPEPKSKPEPTPKPEPAKKDPAQSQDPAEAPKKSGWFSWFPWF